MVALAQSPPGGSSARSLQKKTTVMLDYGPYIYGDEQSQQNLTGGEILAIF
jgi:hypothetical protein